MITRHHGRLLVTVACFVSAAVATTVSPLPSVSVALSPPPTFIVALNKQYAYAAGEATLYVIDATTAPRSPVVTTIPLPCKCHGLAMSEKGLLVLLSGQGCAENGLRVYSIADGADPRQVHAVSLPGSILTDVAVFGDYAFVSASKKGLHIVHILQGSLVDTMPLPVGSASCVATNGPYVYVGAYNMGVFVIDAVQAKIVRRIEALGTVRALAADRMSVYVAVPNNFVTLDLTDLSAPKRNFLPLKNFARPLAQITVHASRVYTGTSSRLFVIDVASSASEQNSIVGSVSAVVRANYVFAATTAGVDVYSDATDVPATDVPETAAPPTEVPIAVLVTGSPTDVPETVAPDTDVPETDAPPTGLPVTDIPETDVPATDSPPTDLPATVAPPTDAPATDVPPTAIPIIATDAPTDVPETVAPPTDAPATAGPPTDVPETVAPDTGVPATAVPPTDMPATVAPPTDAPATDASPPVTPTPPVNTPTPATPTPSVTYTKTGHNCDAGKAVQDEAGCMAAAADHGATYYGPLMWHGQALGCVWVHTQWENVMYFNTVQRDYTAADHPDCGIVDGKTVYCMCVGGAVSATPTPVTPTPSVTYTKTDHNCDAGKAVQDEAGCMAAAADHGATYYGPLMWHGQALGCVWVHTQWENVMYFNTVQRDYTAADHPDCGIVNGKTVYCMCVGGAVSATPTPPATPTPTDVPETAAPPTDAPTTAGPPTDVPETVAPDTGVPATDAPPTAVPATDVPETVSPPTDVFLLPAASVALSPPPTFIVALNKQYAYAAGEATLYVIDATTAPRSPVVTTIPLPCKCHGLAVSEKGLLVLLSGQGCAENGLRVYSIADGADPRQVHAVSLPGSILTDVAVFGDYAFVSASKKGLRVVHILQGSLVDTMPLPMSSASCVATNGPYVYVGAYNMGVFVIDTVQAKIVRRIEALGTVRALAADRMSVYVAVPNNFVTLDLTDLSAPKRNFLPLKNFARPLAQITVHASRVYTGTSSRLFVIDVASSASEQNSIVGSVSAVVRANYVFAATTAGVDVYSDATDVPATDVPETAAPPTPVPIVVGGPDAVHETGAPPTGLPETVAPDTDVPETDAPPTGLPVTDIPETDVPATDSPPTDLPATDAPPTDVPATVAPPTDAPATDIPPTAIPSIATDAPTDVPETAAPPTDAPATAGPPTDVPETVAPDTGVPATAVPPTDMPATVAPPTDAPATDAPPTAVPATDVPETAVPATVAPPTDAPATDSPPTDVPATDVPETAAPPTEVPIAVLVTGSPTDVPETAAPPTDAPTTAGPPTDVPETVAPDTGVPATVVPSTDLPATDSPPTDVPETLAPSTDVPVTDVPETVLPATAAPPTEVPATDIPPTDIPIIVIATDAPPTTVPETVAPPTDAPATDAPPTAVPATDVPETVVPATVAPPTDAPATDSPPTNISATSSPPTDVPATVAPPTDVPTTDVPLTDTPIVSIVTDAPTDTPATAVPATDAPLQAPPTHAPSTDRPSTDVPLACYDRTTSSGGTFYFGQHTFMYSCFEFFAANDTAARCEMYGGPVFSNTEGMTAQEACCVCGGGSATPPTPLPATPAPPTDAPIDTATPPTQAPPTDVPETAVPDTPVPDTDVPETPFPPTLPPDPALLRKDVSLQLLGAASSLPRENVVAIIAAALADELRKAGSVAQVQVTAVCLVPASRAHLGVLDEDIAGGACLDYKDRIVVQVQQGTGDKVTVLRVVLTLVRPTDDAVLQQELSTAVDGVQKTTLGVADAWFTPPLLTTRLALVLATPVDATGDRMLRHARELAPALWQGFGNLTTPVPVASIVVDAYCFDPNTEPTQEDLLEFAKCRPSGHAYTGVAPAGRGFSVAQVTGLRMVVVSVTSPMNGEATAAAVGAIVAGLSVAPPLNILRVFNASLVVTEAPWTSAPHITVATDGGDGGNDFPVFIVIVIGAVCVVACCGILAAWKFAPAFRGGSNEGDSDKEAYGSGAQAEGQAEDQDEFRDAVELSDVVISGTGGASAASPTPLPSPSLIVPLEAASSAASATAEAPPPSRPPGVKGVKGPPTCLSPRDLAVTASQRSSAASSTARPPNVTPKVKRPPSAPAAGAESAPSAAATTRDGAGADAGSDEGSNAPMYTDEEHSEGHAFSEADADEPEEVGTPAPLAALDKVRRERMLERVAGSSEAGAGEQGEEKGSPPVSPASAAASAPEVRDGSVASEPPASAAAAKASSGERETYEL